jgi:hypothetical protein
MLVCTVILAFRTSAMDRPRDQRSPAPLMASKISCADDGAPEQRIFWASATSLFSLALTAGMAILRCFGLQRATKRPALKDADVKCLQTARFG